MFGHSSIACVIQAGFRECGAALALRHCVAGTIGKNPSISRLRISSRLIVPRMVPATTRFRGQELLAAAPPVFPAHRKARLP